MKFFKKYTYLFVPLLAVLLFFAPAAIDALTTKYKAINIEATTAMILNGVSIGDWGEAAGFKLKVSSDDTTENFLLQKLLGSSTITLTETNPGSNETYVTSVTALSINTGQLTADGVTLAKMAAGTANRAYVTDGSGDPALELLDFDVMQTQSQGEILIYGASGVPEVLAGAATGRVLTTNGVTSNPSWNVGHGIELFTTSGTWVHRDGITTIDVTCIGAGGGGAIGGTPGGSAGGGGEWVQGFLTVSGDITVTIGAGGLGGEDDENPGIDLNPGLPGGDSTFGALLTANGGGGGVVNGATGGAGGTGGSITGTDIILVDGTDGETQSLGADGGVHGFRSLGNGALIGGIGHRNVDGTDGSDGTAFGDGGGGGDCAGGCGAGTGTGGDGADGFCSVKF